ncbi:MAG TPA: pyridoxal-dependent decarboxylase [Bacteroidota bacterium]
MTNHGTTGALPDTLDPSDWEALRALGRRMVDDMLQYLQTVRDRPVWQPIPATVTASFKEPLPHASTDAESVYEDFRSRVLPYPTGNVHPRFWGWVMGNGTPGAMLADMLASGINLNQGGGQQSGSLVEAQVIAWCKEMFGFPADASGLLVSGGSVANLTGLAVARNARAGYDIRAEGLQGAHPPMRVYASSEVHSSVHKAMELLGLGRKALCLIPVGADYRIRVEDLRRAVREDRAHGVHPLCIVGCAGTVNTGAIDPLNELADFCVAEGIWYHVDGAFGGLAVLAPELRDRVRGIERADSIAFDMHKWMYLPYEIGATLVRDKEIHHRAFAFVPDYLEHGTRGLAGSDLWFSDYGIQLSRGFRALKAWMAIKEHGVDRIGRIIHRNVEQAAYLAGLVRAEPELELLAPVPLNIVCFRYRGNLLDGEQLNELNKELLLRLHESGVAAPSYTVLEGKYAIRVANTNYRSTQEDFDILVREVLRLGRVLSDDPGV